MSRRVSRLGLILVLAIWCGVLLSPTLRLLLRAQASPQWPSFLQKIGVKDEEFARVLREHPDDPRVLAYEIEQRVPPEDLSYPPKENIEDYSKARLRLTDELIERFPKEKWLIQNRMLLSLRGSINYHSPTPELGPVYPSSRQPTWLSPAELRRALKIAERGAQFDPQNSFYDWMRAGFLFALQRKNEAMQALRNGARKPHFDDGTLRDVQNRVEVRALQEPLLWEDRVAILAAIMFPHYSLLSQVNRAAVWNGVLAERKGDHRRALEIYGDQMRLARVIRRDAKNYITVIVSENLEQTAWSGVARKHRLSSQMPRKDTPEAKALLASRFANYARLHGRADLASEALRDVSQFEAGKYGNWSLDNWFGISTKVAQPMFRLHWTNFVLLRAVLLSTLAWSILSVLLWRAAHHQNLARVSNLDVASGVLFIGAASGVLFVTILRSANWMELALPSNTVLYSETQNTVLNFAPKIIPWLPLALTFLYCSVVMLWRGRKSTPVVDNENSRISGLRKAERIFIWLAFGVAMFAFSAWWWNWLWAQELIYAFTFPGFLLPLFVGWIFYRILKRFLAQRPTQNIVYGFAWSRSTLGILVVVGSVAYFICALLALPLRREADARMNEYIARGEVALMREAAGK